jgi:hypothetical protein
MILQAGLMWNGWAIRRELHIAACIRKKIMLPGAKNEVCYVDDENLEDSLNLA